MESERQKQEAFVSLVKENEALIRKVCRIYAPVLDERQDLFQEIVLQLWKAYGSFRNESKVSTWIYRVALNTAINHRKKEHRHRTVDRPLPDSAISDHGDAKEQLRILHAEIEALGDIDKAIAFLYLEGYRYPEIAVMSGLTETNVATRLSRIKRKIIDRFQTVYNK
jgi:RNA polymerase sigma factor (sigma-70 family)